MTTARDLALVAADPQDGAVVEQGDLSLALAGAELIDLLDAGSLTLDGARLVPAGPAQDGDPLLTEAAQRLADGGPGTTVADWLWSRGRDLAGRYRSVLEAQGLVAPERRSRNPLRRQRTAPADPSAARAARERATGDPVLGALAAAAGLTGQGGEEPDGLGDDHAAVLAAVLQAVTELAGERQRRTIESAAFDNIWRGD